MYLYTLREVPAEAEIASHILLLRAGFIRKQVAGVYAYLPLGARTLRKIENIVREEMDAIGAQEIKPSILEPAELWQESGRWTAYGPEMWRLKDRNSLVRIRCCINPFCYTFTNQFIDLNHPQHPSFLQSADIVTDFHSQNKQNRI